MAVATRQASTTRGGAATSPAKPPANCCYCRTRFPRGSPADAEEEPAEELPYARPTGEARQELGPAGQRGGRRGGEGSRGTWWQRASGVGVTGRAADRRGQPTGRLATL